VLQLLRRHRYLSRAELARRTGLSEAAVSRIVAVLLQEGIVVEQGGEEVTGGRPAIRLQLNEAQCQAIGVDVQVLETRISTGTITGRILSTRRFRTPSSAEEALRLIVEELGTSNTEPGGAGALPVGIAVRGLVNSDTGIAELGSDPTWVHVPVRQYLSEQLGRFVLVENNVRAAAQAEHYYGDPEIQGSHCLLFVKVDEGVGMGIILDARLYRGPRMAAGEFGQMVIADEPTDRRHDRPGCLELLASDLTTIERYRRAAGISPGAPEGGTAEEVKRICHMAMADDPAARDAVVETCRNLGIGIANAVWALDAETVVIDGAITEAWPLVVRTIRDQFPSGREFINFNNLILRPSSLRGDASIIGAVTLPFVSMFSSGEDAE